MLCVLNCFKIPCVALSFLKDFSCLGDVGNQLYNVDSVKYVCQIKINNVQCSHTAA